MCKRALLAVGLVLMLTARANTAEQAEAPKHVDVFVPGTDDYPHIRIPAVMTTKQGALLAFAEGRQGGDHSENDIILKRSSDGGRTWGKLQIVVEDGKNSLNNPQAVVVGNSGRILLMYQRYPQGFHSRNSKHTKTVDTGYEGPRVCRSHILHSDDDGVTWSMPREITRQVKRPAPVTSVASGPGVGIQLRRGQHKGRLVMPFNEGPWGRWRVYAVYSDDAGETWRMGEVASNGPKGYANEVQMVELADGAIQLNARVQGGNGVRQTAISRDGGESWTNLVEDKTLIEPICQGTILRYSDPLDGQKSRILFANPASRRGRKNGTVRLSYDEGRTWPVTKVVYPGGYAYSCLTVLDDGTIGLLFERDGYRAISFVRLSLDWLTDGQDALKEKSPKEN